jgi:alkaline phosphatase D
MLVEWSCDERFHDVTRLRGPHALETTDFTARQGIHRLEAGSEVLVRVFFESLHPVVLDS